MVRWRSSSAGFPSVRIIDNGVNLGFAAGNNAGARAAAGELLVFLNNDTVAESTWLAALHSAHLGGPGRDLVTSKLVWLDRPEVVDSAGDGYLRAGGAYKVGHGAAASPTPLLGEVFGACGAAFLIRRALFESLGGFDERFFMVYEDVDLSYRARLRGHRAGSRPRRGPPRGQRDAGVAQRSRRFLRSTKSRVDLVQEHAGLAAAGDRCRRTPCIRWLGSRTMSPPGAAARRFAASSPRSSRCRSCGWRGAASSAGARSILGASPFA